MFDQVTVWVLLLLFGALVLAWVGFWLDRRRAHRELLLTGDATRAKATLDYYIHVQDSHSA